MFKTIKEAPMYEINIEGEVRHKKTQRVRKHSFADKMGYPYVMLDKEPRRGSASFKCYIHREVAKQFLPNPDNLLVVLHKDDDVLNHNIDNLKWGTQKENMVQSSTTGAYSKKKMKLKLISPSGEVVEVTGLRTFCDEQGLDWGNFGRLRRGKALSVKGWRLFNTDQNK